MRRLLTRTMTALCAILTLSSSCPCMAAETEGAKGKGLSKEELAKLAQNPVANLVSIPIQNDFNYNVGPHNGNQYVGNFQPVIPFSPTENWNVITRTIVPDGRDTVATALQKLADEDGADLILVTGGTGPAPRDQTPEALDAVIEKRLPGFGEAMRLASLAEVPTAILSRQDAGIRGKTLIITLPGKPSAIATCLKAVFRAVPYCLDLIGAARIETDPAICDAFRPKTN